jgi:hypothetical protein
MTMSFASFKRAVCGLFPGQVYLVPGDNWLVVAWERGSSPEGAAEEISRLRAIGSDCESAL